MKGNLIGGVLQLAVAVAILLWVQDLQAQLTGSGRHGECGRTIWSSKYSNVTNAFRADGDKCYVWVDVWYEKDYKCHGGLAGVGMSCYETEPYTELGGYTSCFMKDTGKPC